MMALIDGMPLVPALGWSLLHFLWQGAVVGLVFALLRALIPARNSELRYWTGLVALLTLAALPVVTFLNLYARQVAQAEAAPVVDTGAAMMASTTALGAVATPMASILPWVVAFWLVGVVLVGLRSWFQWRALVLVARMWSMPDARLQEIAASLAQRFGFARRFCVRVSDRIDTPTLIGWIKPVILLPTAVVLGFPRQQIELILAHELGHLRRYDHVINLAQAIVETLLFYHPVVHWIAREVRNEREICCDQLVLRVTRGEPREYASTLAALEELRLPPVHLALAASGGALLERVRRILFASQSDAARVRTRMWLPLLTTLILVLAVAVQFDRSRYVQVDIPSPWSDVAWRFSADARPTQDVVAERIGRTRFELIQSAVEPEAVVPIDPAPAVTASQQDRAPIAAAQIAQAPLAQAGRDVSVPTQTETVALAETAPPVVAPVTQAVALTKPLGQATSAPRMPVAVRTVTPEYPDSTRESQTARVELRFTIDAKGVVRDIAQVEGVEAGTPFVRAAKRALSQWRFRPAEADGSVVYRQAFVFAPEQQAEEGCVRRTGSQLCRRGDNSAHNVLATTTAGEDSLAVLHGK